MDLQALKDDIAVWPEADFATMDDAQIAAAYAEVRASITVTENAVSSDLVRQAINLAEYEGLTIAQRQWVDLVLSSESVRIRKGEVRPGLLTLFGPGSVTRGELIAAIQRRGARWEEQDWERAPTPSEVANARRLP